MAPVSTPAILLRAHAYGETSRILRFYTRSHGLLSVMARGVRARAGKGSAAVDTFASGELSVFVRPQRDLHTMKDFSGTHPRSALGGDVLRFAGASAVSELVVTHTEQEAHPDVFAALESALDRLEGAPATDVPAACLSGLWRVVAAFGFPPELEACLACGEAFGADEVARFDLAAGGLLCPRCGDTGPGPRIGPVARAQLRALVAGADEPVTHPRRHLALLSDFIAFHVATRPLKAIRFLGDLLPPDPEA